MAYNYIFGLKSDYLFLLNIRPNFDCKLKHAGIVDDEDEDKSGRENRGSEAAQHKQCRRRQGGLRGTVLTCSTTTNFRAGSLASASTTESRVFITHAPWRSPPLGDNREDRRPEHGGAGKDGWCVYVPGWSCWIRRSTGRWS